MRAIPPAAGKLCATHAGKVEPIKKTEKLRLAHPVDLLASKAWTNWQRDCFTTERTQPFKQVFRELYVLTSQEKSDATFSQRYAGHQVNPRQAMALSAVAAGSLPPNKAFFARSTTKSSSPGSNSWSRFLPPPRSKA